MLAGAVGNGGAALGTRDQVGGGGGRGASGGYGATAASEDVFLVVALGYEVHLGEDAIDADFFGFEARAGVVTVPVLEFFEEEALGCLLAEAVGSARLATPEDILVPASIYADSSTGQLGLQDQLALVCMLMLATTTTNHDRGHFLSKFLAGVYVLMVGILPMRIISATFMESANACS